MDVTKAIRIGEMVMSKPILINGKRFMEQVLVVLNVFRCVRKAIGFELFGYICFYSFDDLVCAVAVLLFISGVSTGASSHDISLFLVT